MLLLLLIIICSYYFYYWVRRRLIHSNLEATSVFYSPEKKGKKKVILFYPIFLRCSVFYHVWLFNRVNWGWLSLCSSKIVSLQKIRKTKSPVNKAVKASLLCRSRSGEHCEGKGICVSSTAPRAVLPKLTSTVYALFWSWNATDWQLHSCLLAPVCLLPPHPLCWKMEFLPSELVSEDIVSSVPQLAVRLNIEDVRDPGWKQVSAWK